MKSDRDCLFGVGFILCAIEYLANDPRGFAHPNNAFPFSMPAKAIQLQTLVLFNFA